MGKHWGFLRETREDAAKAGKDLDGRGTGH